ncbi:MAG: AAC(3) family N-acetyltransferase [Ktedonobacteraceae bacterium]|nr:AAC(3) family N-acetyltransferase [Ktedonobacteraceae bacterium]
MSITSNDIQRAVRELGLSGQVLCVHSSLRSLGHVEGGAGAVLDGLLAEDCTVLVPAFLYEYAISPPTDPWMRPERNGYDYDVSAETVEHSLVYSPDVNEVHKGMGALPAAVLARAERARGNHPLNSFAAVGSRARDLVGGQGPLEVYAPFEKLVECGGWVVMMGVDLTSMTLIHYAEQQAGRVLFRRWANGSDGYPMMVAVGSCSRGFGNFDPIFAPFERQRRVGQSLWRVFPARLVLEAAAQAIRERSEITHCIYEDCERCNDAVQGGPLLARL